MMKINTLKIAKARGAFLLSAFSLATLFISCGEDKEEAGIGGFGVKVINDTVPATVEVEYTIHVENTCAVYTLDYTGADSVKGMAVVDYASYTLDDLEFSVVVSGIDNGSSCVKEGASDSKALMRLLYLKAGEYEISLNMGEDSFQETITVYAPDKQSVDK